MRVSVRSIVIAVPIVFALIFGWMAHRHRAAKASAIEAYRSAVVRGVDASPNGLVRTLGEASTRELILSLPSPDIAFDGTFRRAQILRVPHAHCVDMGDGIVLHSLKHPGASGTTLPLGAKIEGIDFEDNDLLLSISGVVSMGSYRFAIPSDEPVQYRIRWPKDAPVPSANINMFFSNDFCIPSNHIDRIAEDR